MTDVAPARIDRACAKCGLTDSHAHHVQYVAFAHPVTGESQDLSISKHIQCCAEDGCLICATDMEHASQKLTDTSPSDEFTALMVNKEDTHLQALFETHAIESPNYVIPATATEEEASNG